MEKYWVGITSKQDYMATYGVIVEASSEEEARQIIEQEYPGFYIDTEIKPLSEC